jgi:DNA-binding NarL/FixJ family response regulator
MSSRFTPKEIEILGYLVRGYRNKQIADELHIAERTVKNHLTYIYLKLNVRNRLQAVIEVEKNQGLR